MIVLLTSSRPVGHERPCWFALPLSQISTKLDQARRRGGWRSL
jgi:hypothetical protein